MDVVEKYLVLISDDFDAQDIYNRIWNSRDIPAGNEMPEVSDISALTRHILWTEFLDYPVVLEPLVDHQIRIVEDYFSDHPDQLARSIAPCSDDDLQHRVILDEAKQIFDMTENSNIWRKWQLLLARLKIGDELWTYSSPTRSGYALVRAGSPIASIETEIRCY